MGILSTTRRTSVMNTIIVVQKPSYMQAFQYDGDLQNSKGEFYVPDWAKVAYKLGQLYYSGPDLFLINEPYKAQVVHIGDWLVNSNDGILIHTDESFRATYDIVEDNRPTPTPKQHFMTVMNACIRLQCGVNVVVQIADSPKPETIYNPFENLAHKIVYYDNMYDEDLKLKSNPKIRIIQAYTALDNMSEVGWIASA